MIYLINGDAIWCDPDNSTTLGELAEFWNPEKMDILLLLQPVKPDIPSESVGDYTIDECGRASHSSDKKGTHMFTGVRIVNPGDIKRYIGN